MSAVSKCSSPREESGPERQQHLWIGLSKLPAGVVVIQFRRHTGKRSKLQGGPCPSLSGLVSDVRLLVSRRCFGFSDVVYFPLPLVLLLVLCLSSLDTSFEGLCGLYSS